ncbi:MAG: peptidylprolyl isomerase [Gemmatimonadota bacterium]
MRNPKWLAGLAVLTITVSGCEGLRDAFSAQADVVATAGSRKLTTDRMLGLMNSVQSGRVSPEGAEYVANLWVDLTLFAQARINGGLSNDSTVVARVMWPEITQGMVTVWRDSLAKTWPAPTAAAADSVYAAGEVRLFQHILKMPAGGTPKDTAAVKGLIAGTLAGIRGGANFAELAAGNNDATKDDGGYLGVGPRGQFVPEFEEAAWALEPGQVSAVVQSPFGWHLIRRPTLDESRARFVAWMEQRNAIVQDSIYLDRLASEKKLELVKGAAPVVKEAMTDLDRARKSNRALVKISGDNFTLGDLARWVEAFPPNAKFQIAAQPDTVIEDFVTNLAQNELILADARNAKVGLGQADWQAVQLSYRATVDQLAAAIGLSDSVVSDSTLPKAQRTDSALSRVERFMDQLVAGQAQFRPFSQALAGYLRESGPRSGFNRAGMTRVMELYNAKVTADSAAAAASQPGPMQPAPGPAPVPGGTPPTP